MQLTKSRNEVRAINDKPKPKRPRKRWKRVVKWTLGTILVVLILWGFVAYWTSTNDCGRDAAAPGTGMTFRRFEGVYFQRDLGIVHAEVIDGFERSYIAILTSKSAQAWWANSKEIFSSGFVSYVEDLLEKGTPKTLHPVFRPD